MTGCHTAVLRRPGLRSYPKEHCFLCSFPCFTRLSYWYNKFLTFICPCFANIIPNYNQQDATFLNLFISTESLNVSGCPSAHQQEHVTVHTAPGVVNKYCSLLLAWMKWNLIHGSNKQQYWLLISEAVCRVMCSWWWAEELPETCRAFIEINKLRNFASCW